MIPDHITPAQLTAAFAAMGLEAGEVISCSIHGLNGWVDVRMRPVDAPAAVEFLVLRVPIRDAAPPPADLIGELKEAQG